VVTLGGEGVDKEKVYFYQPRNRKTRKFLLYQGRGLTPRLGFILKEGKLLPWGNKKHRKI